MNANMNSEHMCIDDSRHRPALIRLLEAVVTGIVWLAYVGVLPLIWSAFMKRGAATGAVSRSFPWSAAGAGPGFGSFVMQVGAVALCGSSLLYCWALYNRQRFRGKDRRQATVTATAMELAEYYGGTPEQIVSLQQERRLFMRHDADGRLTRVHYGEPPDPRDSALLSHRRVRRSSGHVREVTANTAHFDAMSTQELRRYIRVAKKR
jgi:poly-beta-1,6-N-acetyl-D-glucosamine biosynthesis protein PgaD